MSHPLKDDIDGQVNEWDSEPEIERIGLIDDWYIITWTHRHRATELLVLCDNYYV